MVLFTDRRTADSTCYFIGIVVRYKVVNFAHNVSV